MRVKLKNDVFFLKVEDGAYLKNNQGAFTLKGKTVYDWLEHLVPYLTGDYTLEDLCRNLSEDKRKMVRNLVEVLIERKFVKQVVEGEAHSLSQAELQIYRSQIEFIDYFQDSAERRFERFRAANVILIGSGLTVASVAHSLMDSGLRRINVLFTEDDSRRPRVLQYFERFSAKDSLLEFHEPPPVDWQHPDSVSKLIADYDIVLHSSDELMLDRTRLLNRLCVSQGKLFLQGMVVDGQGWVGPLVQPSEAGCWECSWRRYRSALGCANDEASLYQPRDYGGRFVEKDEYFSPTAAAIIGNTITFEAFKQLTGTTEPEAPAQVFLLNLETLETSFHSFLPHPSCSSCAPTPPRTAEEVFAQFEEMRMQRAYTDRDSFIQSAQKLVDERIGVLTSLEPGDLVQLPLARCEASIAEKPQEAKSARADNMIGAGRSHNEARYWAARKGLETYLSCLADERRFSYGVYAELRNVALNPNDVWGRRSEGISDNEEIAWLYGYDLLQRRPRLLPAASVFPHTRWNRASDGRELFTPGTTGLASGHSLDEVIARGILSFSGAHSLEKLGRVDSSVSLVSLASLDDPECLSYLRMISRYEETVAVHDVSNGLGVPTLAFSINSRIEAYSTHLNDIPALRNGLRKVVEVLQERAYPRNKEMRPAPAQLPSELTSVPVRSLEFRSQREEENWAEIATELLDRCFRARQELVLVGLSDRHLLPGEFLAGRIIALA